MAAAVAAAAQDSEEEQQWQQQLQEQSDQLPAQRNRSWAGSNPNNSSSSARNSFAWRQHSVPAAGPLAAVAHDPLQLRLGSTVTAATVKDAKVELQCAESRLTAEGRPVSSGGNLYSGSSSRALGREQPCPSISGTFATSGLLVQLPSFWPCLGHIHAFVWAVLVLILSTVQWRSPNPRHLLPEHLCFSPCCFHCCAASVQLFVSCWRTPTSCFRQPGLSRSGCGLVSGATNPPLGPRWWRHHSW